MKTLLMAAAITVALAPAAMADPGNGKGPKGHPHGMPPGQAKKYWSKGERLPAMYVTPTYYVADPVRYELRPAPVGYRYYYVDDRIYLVQTTTGLIASVVTALLR